MLLFPPFHSSFSASIFNSFYLSYMKCIIESGLSGGNYSFNIHSRELHSIKWIYHGLITPFIFACSWKCCSFKWLTRLDVFSPLLPLLIVIGVLQRIQRTFIGQAVLLSAIAKDRIADIRLSIDVVKTLSERRGLNMMSVVWLWPSDLFVENYT